MTDERLAKLVRMLSSDRDGEVVSAARAIGRTLKDTGADWHDFAARLSKPQHANDWRNMRELCLRCSTLLRPHELKFVTSLASWHGNLTEKQFAWLSAIHERVRQP